MNACVHRLSVFARSCQEMVSAAAFMCGLVEWLGALEGRRGAGADDLARLTPNVAKPMRQMARKIVRLASLQNARDARKRELDAAANDDAALFASVREHLVARFGAGRVALVKQRELPAGPFRGHEAQR